MVPGDAVESPKHSAGTRALDGLQSRSMTATRGKARRRLAGSLQAQWGCTHMAPSGRRDIGRNRVHGALAARRRAADGPQAASLRELDREADESGRGGSSVVENSALASLRSRADQELIGMESPISPPVFISAINCPRAGDGEI